MKTPAHQNTPITEVANSDMFMVMDKSGRLAPFRTCTFIIEENGKKVVYKCPTSEKAKAFVKGLIEKEKTNASYLVGYFDVHSGTLEGDCIKYDYLPYPSLTDKMKIHMQEGNFIAANELLERYVQKIESLETINTVPEKFLMLIANRDNYSYKSKCLRRGLFDLTPKNILIDSERWVVIDNEWSFDFAIPVVFILFRAIRELSITLQSEIRQITSQDISACGVLALGLRTYYVPLVWIKYILTANISLWRLVEWEAGFWQYTVGAKKGYVGRIKKWPSLRKHFSARSIACDSQILSKMNRFIKSVPGVAKLVHILDQ